MTHFKGEELNSYERMCILKDISNSKMFNQYVANQGVKWTCGDGQVRVWRDRKEMRDEGRQAKFDL